MTKNDYFNDIIDYIKNNDELQNYLSSECDLDIEEYDQLTEDLSYLMEYSNSNYELEPFACDGSGGIYALLDRKLVGYLDSEGQAGIVANNINDFFSIIVNCGCLSDWAKFGWLERQDVFMEHYQKCELQFVRIFSEKYGFESDPLKIYQMFRNAVLTEPRLIITATSEDYTDFDQLFEI